MGTRAASRAVQQRVHHPPLAFTHRNYRASPMIAVPLAAVPVGCAAPIACTSRSQADSALSPVDALRSQLPRRRVRIESIVEIEGFAMP